MSYINDAAFDLAVGYVVTNGTNLTLCSAEPANYAGIAAVALATKSGVTPGAASDGTPSGRKTTVPATTAVGTANGTAAFWALHSGSVLAASGPLNASLAITSGISYDVSAFDVGVKDATAS